MSPKLYGYQRIGVRKIHKFGGRALLADEMGLGKTAQALWYYKIFVRTGRMLVVCPKSIKINWERECWKHIKARAVQLGSRTHPPVLPPGQIYIINYDVLWSWLPLLTKNIFSLLVLDEVHYCKTRNVKRTKAAKVLSVLAKKMVSLSGTPMTNRPIELWPILNMLRPDLWPNFWLYGNRYCAPEKSQWGTRYPGAERIPELHRILKKNVMVRRRKQDVLKDLPAIQWITLPIELPRKDEYDRAERDIIKWLAATSMERANRARRAERLAKLIYLRKLVGELKLPVLKEWISNFLEESPSKLITFGNHLDFLGHLTTYYGDIAVKVTGQVTGKKRQAAFDAIVENKHTRLLFGNTQAAGVGWNGLGIQHVMVGEFPWTPGELDQAAGRIHGLGRGVEGKTSMIYMMAAVGTIDEFMCRTLTTKRKVLSMTFDGKVEKEEIKMFDALENYLVNKGK